MPTINQRQKQWQNRWKKSGLIAAGPKKFLNPQFKLQALRNEARFLQKVRSFVLEDLSLIDRGFKNRIICDKNEKILADIPIGSGNVVLSGSRCNSIAGWLSKADWTLHGIDFAPECLEIARRKIRRCYSELNYRLEEKSVAEVTDEITDGKSEIAPDAIISSRYLIHEEPEEVNSILSKWSNLYRKKVWTKIILVLPLAEHNGKRRKNKLTVYPERDELVKRLFPLSILKEQQIEYYQSSEIYTLLSFGVDYCQNYLQSKLGSP